ncbi:MAG: ATP-binding protein [Chitinophagaceae bacterium]|nr:MAG: ATP-binding protein [Chitinophagaceae bacterium]
MQKIYHTPAELQTALASAINGNQELPTHDLVYDDVLIDHGMVRSIQDLNILVTQSNVRDRGTDPAPRTGIIALFEGPSTSAKILITNMLATQAGVETTIIDLSKVSSKYIGETEKNLARIFDAADKNGNIIFFDEADALFGKRSNIKDSHDRYANIEVSYLTRLAENRVGLTIVSVRSKGNIDEAFLRRLRATISFPIK